MNFCISEPRRCFVCSLLFLMVRILVAEQPKRLNDPQPSTLVLIELNRRSERSDPINEMVESSLTGLKLMLPLKCLLTNHTHTHTHTHTYIYIYIYVCVCVCVCVCVYVQMPIYIWYKQDLVFSQGWYAIKHNQTKLAHLVLRQVL